MKYTPISKTSRSHYWNFAQWVCYRSTFVVQIQTQNVACKTLVKWNEAGFTNVILNRLFHFESQSEFTHHSPQGSWNCQWGFGYTSLSPLILPILNIVHCKMNGFYLWSQIPKSRKIDDLWLKKIYYHPQRSWDKVIFSEACGKNSVHRGVGVVS